jgi:hypothetical protein
VYGAQAQIALTFTINFSKAGRHLFLGHWTDQTSNLLKISSILLRVAKRKNPAFRPGLRRQNLQG